PSFAREAGEPDPAVQESLNKNKEWTRTAVDDFRFRPDDLPALLDAINFAAQCNLGFTEPFSRLAFSLQELVHRAKDPRVAVLVFENLGSGVPATSLYWPALQQQWVQVLSKVPLDWVDCGQETATCNRRNHAGSIAAATVATPTAKAGLR